MQRFEMIEKEQTNIKLTTNAPKVEGEDVIKVYKMVDNAGVLSITEITEGNPSITSIAGGELKRYNLTAPDEDCYLFTLFNNQPQFFRVGTPPIRIFLFADKEELDINYRLLNFDGSEKESGVMDELDLGLYYVTLPEIGDYIFMSDVHKPMPVHTPYVVDSVGMSGKIVFQKDQWMLLSVPKQGAKISDLVSEIESKYSVQGSDIFRVFSAYPATIEQGREMLDYKPGVTPDSTKYNFNLVYADGEAKEITGFWCKTEDYTINNDPDELAVYEWNA